MKKADLLLRHGILVTVDPDRQIFYDGAMAVKDGRILAVGEDAEISAAYPAAEEVLDLAGKAVFPGFVNTHNHLFQTLLKGLGDDMVLKDWLATMTFPAARFLTPDDCYDAAVLGITEGIRSGMTCEVDYMYPHAHEGLDEGVLRAFRDTGIRGIFGRGCMDTGEDFGVVPEIMQDRRTIEKEATQIFEDWNGYDDGRIHVWTAPAALWSNTAETLQMLYELATSYGEGITIHVSETMFDREATEALHGCAGARCLEKLGITGPNVLMVHCVHLTEDDLDRTAEHGYAISHNPVSNMYLASGIAPVPQMLKRGITVGLGVDGAASNNSQDMLELMKTTALLQKVATGDPTAITAEKVLEMATIDGARAIGLDGEIGSLEKGKRADFVIFNPLRQPKAVPMHNPVSTLVYSSSTENVESVAVNGQFLLRDGKLVREKDEEAMLMRVQRTAEKLCERGGITNRRAGHVWRSVGKR